MVNFFSSHKLLLLLAIVIASVYSNSFSGPFIYDDLKSIKDNPHIRQLWPLEKALMAPYEAVSLRRRPLTQSEVILHYLKLAFWPSELCLSYYWLAADSPWDVGVASLVIFFIVLLIFVLFKSHPWISFHGILFFLLLAPSSSFYPLWNLAFEHRMYLPLVSIVSLTVISLCLLMRRFEGALKIEWLWGTVLPCLGLLSYFTYQRNQIYQSERLIWQDTLEKRPHNHVAHNYLGGYYKDNHDYQKAEQHFKKAIDLKPNFYFAYLNLADVYFSLNEFDQAVDQLIYLTIKFPKLYTPHFRLGLSYHYVGDHLQAAQYYRNVLEKFPEHLQALNNLAWLLAASQNGEIRNGKEALELAKKVNALTDDSHPSFLLTLATAYAELGDFKKAIENTLKSLTLEDNPKRESFTNKFLESYRQGQVKYVEK